MKTTANARQDLSLSEITSSVPFHLFNQSELAKLMHISRDSVREIARAGAPFYHGRSRPEWLLDWLHKRLTKK